MPSRSRGQRDPPTETTGQENVSSAQHHPSLFLLIQRLKERDEEVLARCWKKAVASIESHLDDDDQDLVRDARKDLLRYVTAGDPPPIKLAPSTDAASGDFTLAEMLFELQLIRERNSPR